MPILPAAIGIVLNQDQTQILLIKRQDVPIWVLPGGGIEENETPEEALIREILEETGCRVNIVRKSAEYFPINQLAAFTTIFICQIESGQFKLSSESVAIEFFPLHHLPSSFFYPHAQWAKENLKHTHFIRRPLTEISYIALIKYLICHPWQVLRFAWTRFFKK